MPDLGPLAWGWLALVLLVASVVRGYAGFGFSALVVAGGAGWIPARRAARARSFPASTSCVECGPGNGSWNDGASPS